MLGLRTAAGIERREFENRFRLSFDPIQAVMETFCGSGHAVQAGERWRLTPVGFLVSNQIIGQALDALANEKLRRMQAVASGDFRILK